MKQLRYVLAASILLAANNAAAMSAAGWRQVKAAYQANPSAANADAVRQYLYSGATALRQAAQEFMQRNNIPAQAPVDNSAAVKRAEAAEAAQKAAEAAQAAESAQRAAVEARVQQLTDDMDAARAAAEKLQQDYNVASAQVAALSSGSVTAADLAAATKKLTETKMALDTAEATWKAKVAAAETDKEAATQAAAKLKDANDALQAAKGAVDANFAAAQATIVKLQAALAAKGSGTGSAKKGLSADDLKKAVGNWMNAFKARSVTAGNALFDRVAAVKANLEKKPRALLPKVADWNQLKTDMIAYFKANPVAKKPALDTEQKKQQQQVAGWVKAFAAQSLPVPADIQARFNQVNAAALAAQAWRKLVADVEAALAVKPSKGKVSKGVTGNQEAATLRQMIAQLNKVARTNAAKAALITDINALLTSMQTAPAKPAVKAAKGVKAAKAVPAQYKRAPTGAIDALKARAAAWVKGGTAAKPATGGAASDPAFDAAMGGFNPAAGKVAEPLGNLENALKALEAVANAGLKKQLAAQWLAAYAQVESKVPNLTKKAWDARKAKVVAMS